MARGDGEACNGKDAGGGKDAGSVRVELVGALDGADNFGFLIWDFGLLADIVKVRIVK